MTRFAILTAATVAFAMPAFAQEQGTIVSGGVEDVTSTVTGDFTFDLDTTTGGASGPLGDYEAAAPGEASGPDVSFDL